MLVLTTHVRFIRNRSIEKKVCRLYRFRTMPSNITVACSTQTQLGKTALSRYIHNP